MDLLTETGICGARIQTVRVDSARSSNGLTSVSGEKEFGFISCLKVELSLLEGFVSNKIGRVRIT
jgi:hypothetical protein